MLRRTGLLITTLALAAACGSAQRPMDPHARDSIAAVLDDWHAAAAASDEERYFAHFAPDGVFLGTDATERWDVEAFRAYAHRPFEEGRGWAFELVRREVVVDGPHAWFDEDLASEHLGPLRGSGVLRFDGTRWRIAHYNLTLTVPNARVDAVRRAIEAPESAPDD